MDGLRSVPLSAFRNQLLTTPEQVSDMLYIVKRPTFRIKLRSTEYHVLVGATGWCRLLDRIQRELNGRGSPCRWFVDFAT